MWQYSHEYLYGPVEIRRCDPGSGRAIHRVPYTGYSVPMAYLTVADGFPFPLSGSVRDAILPIHFASDPHVDSRWWFRPVAVSSESMRAASGPVDAVGAVAIVGECGATGGRSD